jgi:hypothetical protein
MQFYQADQDNLNTYITDLKKAAIGNKKSRSNAQHVKSQAIGAG